MHAEQTGEAADIVVTSRDGPLYIVPGGHVMKVVYNNEENLL